MEAKKANRKVGTTATMTAALHALMAIVITVMMFAGMVLYMPATANAADLVVRFGSNYYNKNQGDTFPMGIYVQYSDKSVAGIGSYTVQISYDTTRLRYSNYDAGGGDVVNNGNGTLTLTGTNNGTDNKTMIRFDAIAGGDTTVYVTSAVVTDANGAALNVASLGSVPVNIKGEEPAATTTENTNQNTTDQTGTEEKTDTEKTDPEKTDKDSDKDNTGKEPTDTENADSADASAENAAATDAATDATTDTATDTVTDATTDVASTGADTSTGEPAYTTGTTSTDASVTGKNALARLSDDTLRMIVIIIVGILAVAIITLIIILISKTAAGKRRQRMNNDSNPDEGRWAFEFDTIDEDKTGEQISQDEIPSQFEENESGFTDNEPDFSDDE